MFLKGFSRLILKRKTVKKVFYAALTTSILLSLKCDLTTPFFNTNTVKISLVFDLPHEDKADNGILSARNFFHKSSLKKSKNNSSSVLHVAAVDVSAFLSDSLFKLSNAAAVYDTMDTSAAWIRWSERKKVIRKYFSIVSEINTGIDTSKNYSDVNLSGVRGLNWIIAAIEKNDTIRCDGYLTIKGVEGETVSDTLRLEKFSI